MSGTAMRAPWRNDPTSSAQLALAIIPGGTRMQRDYRCRRALRIQLPANALWNLFEERASELVHEFIVEIRAADQQEINANSVQRGVLPWVRSAGEQRSSQQRIVHAQTVDLRT